MAKRKASKPWASLKPWPCFVLAIDPGKSSGWSIWFNGDYIESGECSSYDDPELTKVVALVIHLAQEAQVPSALVLEKHPWLGSERAKASLEASRGIWKAKWIACGGVKARVRDVNVGTWRKQLLGKGRGADVVAEEQRRAKAIAKRDVGTDEAAAVCIGKWASMSALVGDSLPKRFREQVLPMANQGASK